MTQKTVLCCWFLLTANISIAAVWGIGDGYLFGERTSQFVPERPQTFRLQPRIEAASNGPSWFFTNLNYFISSRLTENIADSWLSKISGAGQKIFYSGASYGGSESIPDQILGISEVPWDDKNHVVISFGLGDWCSQGEIALREVDMVFENYKAGLSALRDRLTQSGKSFDYTIIAPFSIQTLYFEKILKEKKRELGSEGTCMNPSLVQGKKNSDFELKKMLFENLISTSYMRFCPQLYAPGEGREKLVSQLANRNAILRKKLLEFDYKASDVKILDLGQLIFDAEDLSSNCLTYSRAGHLKIADFLTAKLHFKVD